MARHTKGVPETYRVPAGFAPSNWACEGEITPLYHGSNMGRILNPVVTRSDGDLDFNEREGGGSIVTIRLPRS